MCASFVSLFAFGEVCLGHDDHMTLERGTLFTMRNETTLVPFLSPRRKRRCAAVQVCLGEGRHVAGGLGHAKFGGLFARCGRGYFGSVSVSKCVPR